MSSRESKKATLRRKADSTYDESKDRTSDAYQSSQPAQQVLASKHAILADDHILLPADLSRAALQHSDLTQIDWTYAENELFAAKRDDMKLTMARLIFFRGLDPFASFDTRHWQTRASLLAIRVGHDTSPGGQLYLQAVEEAYSTPAVFVARENFVRVWYAGQAELEHWPRNVQQRYGQLATWSMNQNQWLQSIAEQAMAMLGEPVTMEDRVGAMVDAFDRVMGLVKREYAVGDVERKLEVLSMVGSVEE